MTVAFDSAGRAASKARYYRTYKDFEGTAALWTPFFASSAYFISYPYIFISCVV